MLRSFTLGFFLTMASPALAQGTCQRPQLIGLMEEALREEGMFQNLVPRITNSRTVFDNPNANFPGSAVLVCAVAVEAGGVRMAGTMAFYPTPVPDTYRIQWNGGPPTTR